MSIRNEHEMIIDNKPLAIRNLNSITYDYDDDKDSWMHPFQKLSKKLADEEARKERLRKIVPSITSNMLTLNQLNYLMFARQSF